MFDNWMFIEKNFAVFFSQQKLHLTTIFTDMFIDNQKVIGSPPLHDTVHCVIFIILF